MIVSFPLLSLPFYAWWDGEDKKEGVHNRQLGGLICERLSQRPVAFPEGTGEMALHLAVYTCP